MKLYRSAAKRWFLVAAFLTITLFLLVIALAPKDKNITFETAPYSEWHFGKGTITPVSVAVSGTTNLVVYTPPSHAFYLGPIVITFTPK